MATIKNPLRSSEGTSTEIPWYLNIFPTTRYLAKAYAVVQGKPEVQKAVEKATTEAFYNMVGLVAGLVFVYLGAGSLLRQPQRTVINLAQPGIRTAQRVTGYSRRKRKRKRA